MVEEAGSGGALFCADLTDAGQIDALVRAIDAALGGIDILVNNASVFAAASAATATGRDWDGQLDANAKAPFLM